MKEHKEYYNNGQLHRQYWRNVKGNMEGEHKRWWGNGQLVIQYFYKNGLREGECKSWHESGGLWQHCFYKNDLKQGECKIWDVKENLKEHCFFHKDEVIDITEYVADKNNITEQEYFLLQITFGHFPIIKFDGKL